MGSSCVCAILIFNQPARLTQPSHPCRVDKLSTSKSLAVNMDITWYTNVVLVTPQLLEMVIGTKLRLHVAQERLNRYLSHHSNTVLFLLLSTLSWAYSYEHSFLASVLSHSNETLAVITIIRTVQLLSHSLVDQFHHRCLQHYQL